MKLITEQIDSVEVLTEEKNGKKNLYIQGPFMVAEQENRNKRMYPIKTLREAVRVYNENYVKNGRSIGCLGHEPQPTVSLDKVSHLITELKEKNNVFYGKAKILSELPMGRIAEGLINSGVKLGVSSRAVGSLRPTEHGYSVVGDDLVLNTVDIVSDPSGIGCFVEGLYEGVDWIYSTERQQWVAENTMKAVEKDALNKRLTEERKLLHFENYLRLI